MNHFSRGDEPVRRISVDALRKSESRVLNIVSQSYKPDATGLDPQDASQ